MLLYKLVSVLFFLWPPFTEPSVNNKSEKENISLHVIFSLLIPIVLDFFSSVILTIRNDETCGWVTFKRVSIKFFLPDLFVLFATVRHFFCFQHLCNDGIQVHTVLMSKHTNTPPYPQSLLSQHTPTANHKACLLLWSCAASCCVCLVLVALVGGCWHCCRCVSCPGCQLPGLYSSILSFSVRPCWQTPPSCRPNVTVSPCFSCNKEEFTMGPHLSKPLYINTVKVLHDQSALYVFTHTVLCSSVPGDTVSGSGCMHVGLSVHERPLWFYFQMDQMSWWSSLCLVMLCYVNICLTE